MSFATVVRNPDDDVVAVAFSETEPDVSAFEGRDLSFETVPAFESFEALVASFVLSGDLPAPSDGARAFASGYGETTPEHPTAEECDLEYLGEVAAPGYGTSYRCKSCGRPWLRLGSGYVDPRERVYELSPEDVR